jgi:phage tail-like protein
VSNPFDADSGTYQGRIIPTNWTAPSGEYVFCLGHDLRGQSALVNGGDTVTVAQTFDSTGFNMLRATLHIRAPRTMPSGSKWTVTFGTDNFEYVAIELLPGMRERTLSDLAIPTIIDPTTIAAQVLLLVTGLSDLTEVELPAVYVDTVASTNASEDMLVCCRDPSPGDTLVEALPTISFNVVNVDGTGFIENWIYVSDVLVAVVGGTSGTNVVLLAAGWSIDAFNIDGSTVKYAITRGAPFTSEEVVTVRVDMTTSTGMLTTTWSFTITDTAGPRLLSAIAISLLEVRCVFNEQILEADIEPERFDITLVSDPPAYVPTVVDAVLVDGVTVVLTLNQVATPGATYLVTADRIRDLLLNFIEPPYDTAEFLAYLPELTPATRVLSLYRELPEAERDTDVSGELKLLCDILDEGLRALTAVLDEWPLIVVDPDTAPERFLDAILWELGNPFSWLDLTVTKKRLLARSLIALYALKGCGPGIIAAIRLLLGIEVTIHVYGWGPAPLGETIMGVDFILGSDDEDDLYTFWVIVPEQLDAATRNAVNRIIDVMKVAHERHILIEPQDVFVPDHWAMGYSVLGIETDLHPS